MTVVALTSAERADLPGRPELENVWPGAVAPLRPSWNDRYEPNVWVRHSVARRE